MHIRINVAISFDSNTIVNEFITFSGSWQTAYKYVVEMWF